MHIKFWFTIVAFVAASCSRVKADIIVLNNETSWFNQFASNTHIDFELGPANAAVGSTYAGQGATFSDFNLGHPKFWDVTSHTGNFGMFTRPNAVDGGGGFSTTFNSPVQAVSFYTHDLEAIAYPGTTISFFDSGSNLIRAFALGPTGNGHGEQLWGFNGFFSDAVDIARIDLGVDIGDAVSFDDFRFATTAIPEPTGGLYLLTACWCAVSRLPRNRKR